jgi:hypothetical protein
VIPTEAAVVQAFAELKSSLGDGVPVDPFWGQTAAGEVELDRLIEASRRFQAQERGPLEPYRGPWPQESAGGGLDL